MKFKETLKALLPRNVIVAFHYLVVRSFIRITFRYYDSMHPASINAIFKVASRIIPSMALRVLPLVWMDESKPSVQGLLRQGVTGTTFGPDFVDRPQSTAEICLPDICYRVFEQARVSESSFSVVLDDLQVIIDRGAISPDQHRYDFTSGHILRQGMNSAIVRFGIPEYIARGIFLGGNGSSNYYHWMVEILPKLEFLTMLPELYQAYPLLVSENAIRTPSFKEALDLYAKGREIVVLGKMKPYVVNDLVYINCPNNLPFNLFGDSHFSCGYVTTSSLSIDFLRKIALEAALKSAGSLYSPKKIFLGRKSELRKYNQEEVFNYLSAIGFTQVFMEELGFMEQVRILYGADIIVGPTGAAWTNLIFCRAGTKGLCWMAEEFGDFSGYSNIAHMVGVNLKYLTYKAGVNSTIDLYSMEYRIELNMIEKGLAALGEAWLPC